MVGQRVVPLRHRSLQLWLLVGVPRGVRRLVACRGSRFATGPVPAGPDPGGGSEFEAPGQRVGANHTLSQAALEGLQKFSGIYIGVGVAAGNGDVATYFGGSGEEPGLNPVLWAPTPGG